MNPKSHKHSQKRHKGRIHKHNLQYMNKGEKWHKAMQYFENNPDALLAIIPDSIEIDTPFGSSQRK